MTILIRAEPQRRVESLSAFLCDTGSTVALRATALTY